MLVKKLNAAFSTTAGTTAFASAVLIAALTTGCSSTESALNDLIGSSEVKDLSNEQIRNSVKDGMIKGMDSNLDSINDVFGDSSAIASLGAIFSDSEDSAVTRSARSEDTNVFGGFTELLNVVGDLADHSTITNINGNTVSLDPNEAEICTTAANTLDLTTSECTQVLSQITLEANVDSVVNNEVVDATVNVNFNSNTFLVVDFTLTSLFYEARLQGLKPLLAELATIEGDTTELPDTMSGSLRLAATISGQEAGAITLSIPTAVEITDTDPQTSINIATTNKLFELAVNGTTETLNFELGINPINLLFTDEDDAGSFPVNLTLNGLSAAVELNGQSEILTITGASIDTLSIKVDNVEALSASLADLDMNLNGAGETPIIALSKALDFDLTMKNIRGIFSEELESNDENQQITATIDVDSGVNLTVVNDDITKVTGGNASIVVNAPEGNLNITVPDGLCLNNSGDEPEVVACPNS